MRKAERLFQLITLLRGRRLAVTAHRLAEMLEVSERTIYRDIQALICSGVPIEGEAGVGYRLDAKFELPPLMFTSEELLALLVGSKMVQTWGDKSLAVGANSALEKITAILPDKLKTQSEHSPIVIPSYFKNKDYAQLSHQLRTAIESKHCIHVRYRDGKEQESTRTLEPLGLVYWGAKWTLIAFCQLRQDYREFRIDRILDCQVTEQEFLLAEEKSLSHYLAQMEARAMGYFEAAEKKQE